jgi:hypothetical protein
MTDRARRVPSGPSAPSGLPVASVVGHLANAQHRRVLAALELGATTAAEVADRTGLSTRDTVAALQRLDASGLVEQGPDGALALAVDRLRATARQAAAHDRPAPDEHGDAPPDHARVLRTFVRDGRLVQIPATRSKRLVVLEHLAQEFEPGRHYSEAQVNLLLGRFHADTAALRRYLVDEGFLDRDSGWYWRAGGWVDDPGAGPADGDPRPAAGDPDETP